MPTIDILKSSFRKLLTYTYFDKSDMVLRRNVASFAKMLGDEDAENRIFGQILSVANGENTKLLDEWLEKMSLIFMPKKVNPLKLDKSEDKYVITNLPPKRVIVDRLLLMTEIPVELMIIDIAWILMYGYKVDARLSKNSWGNRIDLAVGDDKVRKGNALFKKYHTQYRKWWQKGVDEANANLKIGKNISIINFDIENYYHSIDFSFNDFLAEYEKSWPIDKISENRLTHVLQRIYEKYWELTQSSDVEVFCGKNTGKHPLPLGLMSSRILANWYLTPLDNYIVRTYKPYYYGRYVDDCMLVVETQSTSEKSTESINQELPGLFDWADADRVSFKFPVSNELSKDNNRLQELFLQRDKLYIYRFNCELPQSSIEKFEEDQIERSSEFRFQTDEADYNYGGLENITLINALEANEEESSRRFNILEENKYKLSVYLAKLCTRLAKFGDKYERYNEVTKVARYFKGGLLIKHYLLWERLMTVFVLAGRKDLVENFAKDVELQIQQLKVSEKVFTKNQVDGCRHLKDCLLAHLNQSKLMALSLHKQDNKIDNLYIDTFMTRMHYNTYSMQEFASAFSEFGVRLQAKDLNYSPQKLQYKWLPYFVKLYDVICMLCIGNPYDPQLYEKAVKLYLTLNNLNEHSNFLNAIMRQPKDDTVSEFNTNLSLRKENDDKLTIGVINMEMRDEEVENQIYNYGIQDIGKTKSMLRIIDQTTNIPSVRMFVLPELSVPHYELKNFCRYSANMEKAFVAGMEYVVKENKVHNYIVTCLPVVLFGQKDALPIIRLKNYYAPAEIKKIKEKGYDIPANKKVYQNLYHWHGHVFTSYCCYELASIKDRCFFFGKLDAIYCPVYNKDTYYFSNIAESLVRDMHCYFILSNVSHFGDSRVSKPSSHITMNMLKVKGGNSKGNNEVILSTILEIKKLRESQQKTVIEDNDEFKKTPPGYSEEMVKERQEQRFLYDAKEWCDDILAKLNLDWMGYSPTRKEYE